MTAAQLEQLTAAYHRCRAAAEQQAEERDRRRTLQWSYDDDGVLVGTFRLAPEDGALLIRAVTQRQASLDPEDDPTEQALDPVGALRADALCDVIRADLDRQAAGADGDPGDRYLVTVITEPGVIEGDPTAAQGASPCGTTSDSSAELPSDGLCQLADGPGLAPSTARRMLCDQPSVTITQDRDGNVLDLGRRTRRVNRALRRALAQRDGHCRFPGCTSTRTDAHHITHWVDGGPTNLANLVSLCSRHHHRHHQGGFTISPDSTGGLRFTLPNGRELTEQDTTSGASPSGGGFPPPEEPSVCTPDWDGCGVDRPWVVGVLWDTEHPPASSPVRRPDHLT
jgi:hypothetical protein